MGGKRGVGRKCAKKLMGDVPIDKVQRWIGSSEVFQDKGQLIYCCCTSAEKDHT